MIALRASILLSLCTLASSLHAQQEQASVHGIVSDANAATYAQIHITLSSGGTTLVTNTDANGAYSFTNVPAGSIHLTATGDHHPLLTTDTLDLHAGQALEVNFSEPTAETTNITVHGNSYEIAEEEITQQEHQRVLGIVPNFFVTYSPNPAPLSPGQKFRVALHNEIDPYTFAINSLTAGIEQADNSPKEWGQSGSAYLKRYAASYGDDLIGTMLGDVAFPILLHQDRRYYYKGTGTKSERIWYALKSSFIIHGDNGKHEFDYSGTLGDFAAAGISNVYYPSSYRNSFGSIVGAFAVAKATDAAQNLLQEFVIRHLTPHLQH